MEVEVPEIYKKFVKSVAYTFYTPIHVIILSILTHYSIIDEDTLLDLLQIDKRQFRAAIYLLRNDRLVKQAAKKEKTASGATTFIFYYINYYSFLNAVHFRLNRIRKNMVKEEKSQANFSTFQCKNCQKQFQDIDIAQLFDMETEEILCSSCGGQVLEHAPETAAKTKTCMLARFNEQAEYFLQLIQECMQFKLDGRLLDPEITEDHIKRADFARNNPQKAAVSIRNQFAVTGENPDYGSITDQNLNITFNKTQKTAHVSKPLPSWLSDKPHTSLQTSQDQISSSQMNVLSDLVNMEADEGKVVLSSSPSATESAEEKIDFPDVPDSELNGLFEYPSTSMSIADDHSNGKACSDYPDVSDKESVQKVTKIKVNGQLFEFHEIDDDMIKKMSKEEHEKYADLLNEMYLNNL